MRIAAKIVFYILTFSALGFCVAFVAEEIVSRASSDRQVADAGMGKDAMEAEKETVEPDLIDWRREMKAAVAYEERLADRVLEEESVAGGLLWEAALEEMDATQLEDHFVELMARDLEDHKAVEYAGRALQELAKRAPEEAVALLYALSPAEKEKLARSLALGWVANDPLGAFSWIETAWIDDEGNFVDRTLQNDLYFHAMEGLVSLRKDYDLAAGVLESVVDPKLKAGLVELVARTIVRDGPENALDRLAESRSAIFDTAVMDAVALEWAARDSVGAMDWTLLNEVEVSPEGTRSIAKHLALNREYEPLAEFHAGLRSGARRDAVAAEAARLLARREPSVSADWVRRMEGSSSKREAVYDALYEIGYESFDLSVNYIDFVYEPSDLDREPVVYATLSDWLSVDLDAVAGYLGSGRANLSADLSEELLLRIEGLGI